MISGYLTSKQDLIDLLNSCLLNKTGILSIFFGLNVVSLYVDKSFVKGFKINMEEDIKDNINKKSLLLYHLSELMDNQKAFFTFEQGIINEITSLEEILSAEELVLQLQLVNKELKNLMDKVITPLAVLRVLKDFEGGELYHGKSVYRILISSQNTLIEEIRRLNHLFSQGYLDIEKFQNPYRESIEIEYLLKDVEAGKINLTDLLESFQLSKFTGLAKIRGDNSEFELYYKKGKVNAIYPNDPRIFELLINTKKKTFLSIIKIPESLLSLLMLKHAEDKAISGLSTLFMEMGKILAAMTEESRSGTLILYSEGYKSYVLYKEGVLLGYIKEDNGGVRLVNDLSFDKPSYFDLVFYQPMENIRDVVHIFLINVVYNLLLKYSGNTNQLVLSELSSSDILKHHDGTILYRRKPKDEKEASTFLNFLLDLAYKLFDKERLEKELETILSPYKDVLRILQIEEYIKLQKDEGAFS